MSRTPFVVLLLVFALGLALAPHLSAQGAQGWEHRVLSWSPEDTEAVLRVVTGQSLTTVEQMAHEVARADREPTTDGSVQVAVDRRLQEKLNRAGAEGWEAFFVQDVPANVGGVLLPAPRIFMRRRK